MFSTDFIFRQQENIVDNQKCQAGFRPLCNKILVLKPELCQLFLFRSRMELKAMEEASFRVDTAVEAVERGSCNSC